MIIAISGLHGTGKSTVAKLLAEKLNLNFYSTGNIFREIANEKGLTLEELNKLSEKDRNIDIELDNKIKELALKGNCVLDNQLSPYLLGDIIDYCILLKCTKDVRLQRMANRDKDDIQKKIQETLMREESEHKRFIDYYGVDLLDSNKILGTFDLIVDTTFIDIDGVMEVVSTAINEFKRSKSS